MRKLLRPLPLVLGLLFSACEEDNSRTQIADNLATKYRSPQVQRDLEDIRKEGVLRAIAIYNSTEYFLYKGEPMGFEYELLQELAYHLDLELEMVVAKNVNELFDLLNKGEGDIIASGLTITEPRKEIVSFTDYHYITHQALIQRKPENWRRLPSYAIDKHLVSDVIELIGDTVHIPKESSYFERLQNLQQEIGGSIYLDTSVGEANTDDLIRQVVEGEIDYTVADYNIASINKTYYPILDIETPVSFSQRIAWAVRKNSPQLLNEINSWVVKMRKKDLYYILYNKYFKNRKSYKRRIQSEFYSKNSGKISPYDSLFKQFADTLEWDWRLFSSLVYQESRFDPTATSWVGALGLMQMMPSTAGDLGVTDPTNPYQSLSGGTRYLQHLSERFEEIPDTVQRTKFVLASYNCGLGHVLDAQRLAEKYGKNRNIWDKNVELYIRKMSSYKYYGDPVVRYGFVRGEEPYRYVRDIFLRYRHYRSLLPEVERDTIQGVPEKMIAATN